MRDALSILERCMQDGDNQISIEKIRELVGIPEITYIHKLLRYIVQSNIEGVIESTQEVLKEGKDIHNFLWEMIKYTKDILIYKTTGKLEIYNKKELEGICELAEKIEKEQLIKIIYELSELDNSIKWEEQKQVMFEVGLIKTCVNREENSEDLVKRVEKLEDKMKNTSFIVQTKTEEKQENRQNT